MIVEGRPLEIDLIIHGVDVFKLFYICDLDYQPQAKTTWEFLQKCVYEIDNGKGKIDTSPSVGT